MNKMGLIFSETTKINLSFQAVFQFVTTDRSQYQEKMEFTYYLISLKLYYFIVLKYFVFKVFKFKLNLENDQNNTMK